MANEAKTTFPNGSTVVRRDILRGRVWSAAPYRVIADDGVTLTIACWPGVVLMAPTTWIAWNRSGDMAVREQGIPNLASGKWDLDRFTWQDTTLLIRYVEGERFSVSRFFDRDGCCGPWYVDFIQPPRRTALGIDTFDLFLDLIVTNDLSKVRWKDEDEYALGRRLGVIDDATHSDVDEARERVLELIETRQGLFADDWSSWRRDPSWPLPVLPDSLP